MLKFKKLHPSAIIPHKGTKQSAGWDLFVLNDTIIYSTSKIQLSHQNKSIIVPTGIAVKLPKGTFGKIELRSGFALKYGVVLLGGVIDRDYEDGIGIILVNNTNFDVEVKKGQRIAQLVVHYIYTNESEEVDDFSDSDKEEEHKGFGSTGEFNKI